MTKKYSRGVAKFIRRKKAEIRRSTSVKEEQDRLIKDLTTSIAQSKSKQ